MPTYNFANFIGVTLESIISQATGEVEIVIVDGASTDNTKDIVMKYKKRFPRINYFLRDKNIGVDSDMTKSVELANGEYCWFMSSDDKVKPGAVKRIMEEIKSGYDIYICNRTECNFSLKPIKNRSWLAKEIGDTVFDLSSRAELRDYLYKSRSIGALFSYCSSIIFKRKTWNLIGYNDKFTGTGYAHVDRLFSFKRFGSKLMYIKEPLVLCRGDNDSFLERGRVKRFLMDIDGYKLLADNIFPEDPETKMAFLKVMTKEITLHYLIEVRSLVDDDALWENIKTKLSEYGFSRTALYIAGAIGSSKLLSSSVAYLKEQIKRRR